MVDAGPDKHYILANLVQAGRRWRKVAQSALAAHGISQARASALVWAHRLGGGVRQVTLASYIGIEGASLVRLLDELSASGFVIRKDDPDDRRAKTIWLTPSGLSLAEQIETVLETLQERVLAGVGHADRQAVTRVCKAVDDAAALICSGSSSAAAEQLLVTDIPITLTDSG